MGMALKKDFDYDSGYVSVKETRHLTEAPTVGFEWEVPMDYYKLTGMTEDEICEEEEEDENYDIREGARDIIEAKLCVFSDKNKFGHHFECGGVEFQSPKFQTLGTAKSFAKGLIEEVKKNGQCFDFDQGEGQDCGIHVHVTERVGGLKGIDYVNLCLMLGYLDEDDFLVDLSMRDPHKYYSFQTKVHYSTRYFKESIKELNSYGLCDFTNNVRSSFGSSIRYNRYETAEFRLFGPDPKVLIPAIEFAHSAYKFVRTYRKRGVSPTLWSYYKWLKKQKGYKALKAHADFSLLKHKREKGLKHGY